MIDKIYSLIMNHLILLDKVNDTSNKLCHASINKNLPLVRFECDNRERLISILRSIQNRVEEHINTLKARDVTPELLDVLDCWKWDINVATNKINILDQSTMESLQEQKTETSCEIATIFQNHEKIKGYNLKHVK